MLEVQDDDNVYDDSRCRFYIQTQLQLENCNVKYKQNSMQRQK